VGILSNEGVNEEYDNPALWSKKNYSISKVVDFRTSLINSNFKVHIKSFKERFIEAGQEISMAKKPVDVEMNLNKKPEFKISFVQDVMPHGPSVKLKQMKITENPKIPRAVDKVVSDTDFKAGPAMNQLFGKGFDVHYLSKILSVGNLGVKTQRKLVPTRWSITAVDDTVGKSLIKEIKDYNSMEYAALFGGHLGNYYLILFFPEVWSYELFETYMPKTIYNPDKIATVSDYEGYAGRKQYAFNTQGGYYAARISMLEHLKSKRKQASVLALRFVTDEYWAPLGVWVVREAVRKTMQEKPISFSSKELMLKYSEKLINKKFGFDLNVLFRKSKLLHNMKSQKKLFEF